MGRRKIQIAPIVDDRNRNVTFGKRRNGLFKKAFELGVLCQVDVAVLVWSHTGKLHCYSSQGVMHKMIDRYQNQAVDETDISGPNSYGHTEGGAAAPNGSAPAANAVKLSTTKSGNKKRRRSSDDSDDDDDDDGEDDAEEAVMPVKAEKRSNSKNNANGTQTNGADDAMRQDSSDAFANGNMGNPQMPPGNPYGAPYFGGYPNIPGYQQYNAQQQALQNSFGLYGNMSAEAAQRAAAYQAAAAYGFGPSFLINNNGNNNGNQGKYPAAYTPIQSPPPMPESAPTHLQGPNYGGGGGRDRVHQPQRQESMNSEHGSTTSRPELHLSVPGLAPNESALRLDGRGDGQNGRGEPDDGRRSIFHASDSLLHLSENFGPSPSSLFPEIYRSMNHFGDSAAFQAAMAMNSAEEAAAGVFKWPTINNNNSNSSFTNNNTPPAATTKIEETSMRSTQGNEGTATPQNNEENRRSPSHPQGDST